jgi:hypothetical protein
MILRGIGRADQGWPTGQRRVFSGGRLRSHRGASVPISKFA